MHIRTLMLMLALIPTEVFALPTPDVLVSIVNIFPLLAGAVVTSLIGAFYAIRRVLGPNANEFIIGGAFGLLVVMISLVIFMGYSWNEEKRVQRISDITMYLRCDISAHEAYVRRNRKKRSKHKGMWREFGNFQLLDMSDVANQIRKQPSVALISTDRRFIEYQSGIPAVMLDSKLQLFDYIRPKELSAAIKKINARNLYLVDFRPFSLPPKFYKRNKSFFKKFDNIYIIKNITDNHRYVTTRSGGYRPVDTNKKLIEWPIRDEGWLLDEERINFPGIVELLTDQKIVELLDEEDVYFVAPFDSFRRSRHTHEESYIKKLLSGIDSERVISIDMNNSRTSRNLSRLLKKLDGSRFVVVGLTKYDWIYQGIDLAFEIWERTGHDADRFRLLGFTTRLPEAMAIRWEAERTNGIIDMLRLAFWKVASWLKENFGLGTGATIFMVAFLLRMVFSPIGYLEARSRIARSRIKKVLMDEVKPLWSRSSQVLLHHLKVRAAWELAGTVVILLLIYPAYEILSDIPEVFDLEFLWVNDITKPDLLLSIIVGALIYLKMRLGSSSSKQLVTVVCSIAFVLLLLYLPSSLLLYVIGVLTVTITQDFLALRHTNTAIDRALLRTT